MFSSSSLSPEKENEALKKEIETLSDENAKLKANLNDLLSTSSKIQELFEENEKLTKELRTALGEKDEYARRLQISLEKNRELENQNQTENNLIKQANEAKINDLIKKNEKMKEECDNEIGKLRALINEKDKSIRSFDSVLNQYQNQLDQLYTAFSQFFNTNINDFETLLHIALSPKPENFGKFSSNNDTLQNQANYENQTANSTPFKFESYERPSQSTSSTYDSSTKDSMSTTLSSSEEETKMSPSKYLQKKNNIWKEKYVEEQKKRDEYEQDLLRRMDSLTESYESALKKKDEQIEDLNEKIQRQKEKINSLIQDKDDLVKSTSQEKVKYQMDQQEKNNQQIEEKLQYTQKINSLTNDLNKIKDSNDNYKRQLVKFMKSNKEQQRTIDNLNKNNEQLMNENANYSIQNNKLSEQNNELMKQNADLNTEILDNNKLIEEIQAKLRTHSMQLNVKIVELEKARTNAAHFQQHLEQAKTELTKLDAEKKELLSQVQKHLETIQDKDKRIGELTEENSKVKNELQQTKHQLLSSQEPVEETELVSFAAWSCPDFPTELNKIVSDLAKNPTLRLPTKLRHVLTIVAQWYNSKTKRIETELKETHDKNEQMTEDKESFEKKMNSLFSMYDLDFSNIFSSEDAQMKLFKAFQQQRSEMSDAKSSQKQLQSKLDSLLVALEVGTYEEALQTIPQLQNEIAALSEQINSTIEQHEEQNKINEINENKLKKKLSQALTDIENLQNQNKELKGNNNKLERVLAKQKIEIDENKDNLEREKSDLEVRHKAQIIAIDNANKQTMNFLSQERERRRIVEEENKDLKQEIETLKRTQALLKATNDKREKVYQDHIDQKAEFRKIIDEKINAERDQLHAKYQHVILQQSTQIDDMKTNEQTLRNYLEKLDESHQNLLEKDAQNVLEVQKLQLQLQSMKQELEREKRLHQTQLKAQRVSLESELNNQINQTKILSEEKKRSIYSLVCNNFASLFDISTQIDDNNFEIFIKNASEKLKELLNMERRLRQLLSLGPKQSIVDAVSLEMLHN